MIISAEQSRGARGLLGWSQVQLSQAAKISRAALIKFEVGTSTPYDRTLMDIRTALEAAGIEFIDDGVRFRSR